MNWLIWEFICSNFLMTSAVVRHKRSRKSFENMKRDGFIKRFRYILQRYFYFPNVKKKVQRYFDYRDLLIKYTVYVIDTGLICNLTTGDWSERLLSKTFMPCTICIAAYGLLTDILKLLSRELKAVPLIFTFWTSQYSTVKSL